MRKPEVGDVVHVRATVRKYGEGDQIEPYIRIEEFHPVSAIVHVEPRPLQVGDKVSAFGSGAVWHILAIDGTNAWCKVTNGKPVTFSLTELKRAPNPCGND